MDPQAYTDIVKALGLEILPADERDALLEDIGEVIFRGAMRRAWGSLDVKKQDQLTAFFDASNEDPDNEEKRAVLDKFLREQVPDMEHFVTMEVEALKKAQADAYGELTS